jgi:putative transcriptional regulator
MTIRIKLKELIADKEFRENRVVTIKEISEATGIHRVTLSKIANQRGYNVGTDILDRLCAYFQCEVGQLAEYTEE